MTYRPSPFLVLAMCFYPYRANKPGFTGPVHKTLTWKIKMQNAGKADKQMKQLCHKDIKSMKNHPGYTGMDCICITENKCIMIGKSIIEKPNF